MLKNNSLPPPLYLKNLNKSLSPFQQPLMIICPPFSEVKKEVNPSSQNQKMCQPLILKPGLGTPKILPLPWKFKQDTIPQSLTCMNKINGPCLSAFGHITDGDR